ncbi:MAG: hypothetical protein H7124_07950 [Phycisphaerales bacterium]|nr:hypothetical protein [Hyphomonadaceae bacterium]
MIRSFTIMLRGLGEPPGPKRASGLGAAEHTAFAGASGTLEPRRSVAVAHLLGMGVGRNDLSPGQRLALTIAFTLTTGQRFEALTEADLDRIERQAGQTSCVLGPALTAGARQL